MNATNIIQPIIQVAIINSRFNNFWLELVLIVDDNIIESYGQFRSEEEVEGFKKHIVI